MADLPQLVAGELRVFLRPLTGIVEADDQALALTRFLRSCGWTTPEAVDPAPIVTLVADFEEAFAAMEGDLVPDSLEEALTRVEDVIALIDSVRSIGESVASLTVPGSISGPALSAFTTDVTARLLIGWLEEHRPLIDLAQVLGLVERVDVPASGGGSLTRPAGHRLKLRMDLLPTFLSTPVDRLAAVFAADGWDESEGAVTTNLTLRWALGPLINSIGGRWAVDPELLRRSEEIAERGRQAALILPLSPAAGAAPASFGAELEFISRADRTGAGARGPALRVMPSGSFATHTEVAGWSIGSAGSLLIGGSAPDEPAALTVGPSGVEAAPQLTASATLNARYPLDLVVGSGRTGLTLGEIQLALFGTVEDGAQDVGFSLMAAESNVGISTADFGSVVSSIVTFDASVPFDLGLEWSLEGGLRLVGSGSLELLLSSGFALGPVSFSDIRLAFEIDEPFALAVTADAAIAAGPVDLVFEGFGLAITLSLGDPELGLALVPPDGIGLGVEVEGVASGGGFLDLDHEIGRYAGVGELEVLGVGLVAIGILETQIPGAPGRWSLFLSIGATFTGIQLGFGFTLNGVGGLVGIDRGLDEEALGEAVRTGSLDAIMFPENAIAQAALILAEIDAVFPTTPGQYVFGPLVKIGWGTPTLIELDAGVVIQVPEPLTISILGALSAVLPREETPILELHVNFGATVNLTEGTLRLDASLTGSQVVGLLITGDMAVRAAFLDDPTLLVAFGGYHPTFVPPDDFPDLDPVGVSLDTGDALRISLGGYFALTTNSVQVGARADLWAGTDAFSLEGGTSFDAIFNFDPFSFAIDLSLWVSVTAAGFELLGVLLSGSLSGPNPWRVAGSAEFRILGVKKSFAVDESFGELANEGPPEEANPAQLVQEALEREDAWSCLPPAGADPVVLTDPGDGLALHPSGRVQVTQRIVPLDIELECYGHADITGPSLVAVQAVGFAAEDVEDVVDWFASAQYFLLSQTEKLTSPSFTQMKAGLVIGGSGADAPPSKDATFDHEIAYRDPEGRLKEPATKAVPRPARDEAMTRALETRESTPLTLRYSAEEPLWLVADRDTAASTGAVPAAGTDFFSARTAMASRPATSSMLIPAYEAELIG